MCSYSYFAESFHSTDLIKLVEERPALWNPYHASHSNRHLRNKAWESIAAKVVKNWVDLPYKERCGSLLEIKNKWKNIKDTYVKDQKLRINRTPAQRKRKYIYTDLLQFLNFAISDNLPDSESSKNDDLDLNEGTKDEPNDSSIETEELTIIYSTDVKTEVSSSGDEDNNEPIPTQRSILFVDSTGKDVADSCQLDSGTQPGHSCVSSTSSGAKRRSADASRSKDDVGEDPDKMFLLSMLPLFRNLSEQDKIAARIQLTQVLQKLLYPKKN